MKRETKLWLRKRALMALRAIVWHVDEWIQRQEVALRNDLSGCDQVSEKAAPISEKTDQSQDMPHRAPARPETETFEQWEMRKSGVRPVVKRMHRRRQRLTAADFDREIAQRAKEYVQ
jgi:hypothetical protein